MFVSEAVIKQKFTQVNFAELQLQACFECLDELAFNGKSGKVDLVLNKSELVSKNLGDSVLQLFFQKRFTTPNQIKLKIHLHLYY